MAVFGTPMQQLIAIQGLSVRPDTIRNLIGSRSTVWAVSWIYRSRRWGAVVAVPRYLALNLLVGIL